MELLKNIFFNTDKITNYTNIKITYAGKFFENKSKEVFLHYSFDEKWESAKDIKMEKSELGFQAEISIKNSNALNICFVNENKEWDNNNGYNYNFPIEEAEFSLISLKDRELFPKRLSRFYLWKKKIKIRFYKIIRFITGNYKRKSREVNE